MRGPTIAERVDPSNSPLPEPRQAAYAAPGPPPGLVGRTLNIWPDPPLKGLTMAERAGLPNLPLGASDSLSNVQKKIIQQFLLKYCFPIII